MLFRSWELLDRIASVLLEQEVLDGKEFEALMNGEELPPKPERKNGILMFITRSVTKLNIWHRPKRKKG